MTLHLNPPKYHCLYCGQYFRHRFNGKRPRYRASDGYRLEVFEAHHGAVTQAKLSRTHNISAATVERWYQHQNALKRSECSNHTCHRVMGIDEHFFSRKKGFATTFVDLGKHKVFDVKLGRSLAATLESWQKPTVAMWCFSKSNGITEVFIRVGDDIQTSLRVQKP